MSITVAPTSAEGTVIKVIGVGGAGGNAVRHMIEKGFGEVDFICANTDSQALAKTGAATLLKLGDSGLGAGADPDVGCEAAKEAKKKIVEMLQGAHMVFITAGMGGGTGTGAGPVIAEIAREMGILTVGVVTKPFGFEGNKRAKQAMRGIAELSKSVNSLVVILNDKLLEVLGEDVTQKEAFAAADNVLYNAVAGITEIIKAEGVVNVDFMDVRTVMGTSGRALMGYGVASGPERSRKAAEDAIACPLLEGVTLSMAKGVLVNITGSSATLKMKETKQVMDIIHEYVDEEATIIYGAVYDDDMGDDMRVTVVATGIQDDGAAPAKALAPAGRQAPSRVPTLTERVGSTRGTPQANQDPWADREKPAVFRSGRAAPDAVDVDLDVPTPVPAQVPPRATPAARQPVMPSANARGGLGPVSAPVVREERAEPTLQPVAAVPAAAPAAAPAAPAKESGSWLNDHIPTWLRKKSA